MLGGTGYQSSDNGSRAVSPWQQRLPIFNLPSPAKATKQHDARYTQRPGSADQ